jgi:hypothetical protein
MKIHDLNRGLTCVLCMISVFGVSSAANAQCKIEGEKVVVENQTTFWADAQRRTPLGQFTGRPVKLSLQVPTQNMSIAAVKIVAGKKKFEIDAYMDINKIIAYPTNDLEVKHEAVWIGFGRQVKLAGSATPSSRVTVIKTLTNPINETFRVEVPCSYVKLDPTFGQRPTYSSDIRSYTFTGTWMALRDKPSGTVMYNFKHVNSNLIRLWGTEIRSNYIHVRLHGDLVLDGWIPQSEMAVQFGSFSGLWQTPVTYQPGHFPLGHFPTKTVARTISIYLNSLQGNTIVGKIYAGSEVIVIGTEGSFSKVVPSDSSVVSHNLKGFWVKTSDLPNK